MAGWVKRVSEKIIFSSVRFLLVSRSKRRSDENDAVASNEEHRNVALHLAIDLLKRLLVDFYVCHCLLNIALNQKLAKDHK